MRTLLALLALAAGAAAEVPSIAIRATFDPDRHAIDAVASIPFSGNEATFVLHPALEVLPGEGDVELLKGEAAPDGRTSWKAVWNPPPNESRPPLEQIHVHYKGVLYDPPKEEGGLRHVVGGRTSGTIGPEGIYLHGGTAWYPVLAAPMAKYAMEATLPKGWRLVGQGERISETLGEESTTVRWEDPIPANALDVVAGRYVVTDDDADGVRVSAYLFEEEKDFAKLYIDASRKFIAFYSKLLGPYPYKQFSVVENWFSTGYGMPSYTLLGREVVKMAQRYTGAVGLGHEIVHNWWGNSVFVDESQGNWCEGLTSYCTNYYWTEANEGAEAARTARRHLCERFTILVRPDDDFPLAEFRSKETEADNEVGYDKASFLFHTVRRRIGDEAFWSALRLVAAEFRGREASWGDFAAAFAKTGGVDVLPWIEAWRKRKGIPTLAARVADGGGVELSMSDPLPCVVPVRFEGNTAETVDVVMEGDKAIATSKVEGPVARVVVDPDHHVLRRLHPEELVPCLNRTLAAGRRIVVKPTGGSAEERAAYDPVVEKLRQDGEWEVVEDGVDPTKIAGASVVLLGRPGVNGLVGKLLSEARLPEGLAIGPDSFEVGGKKCADPSGALLVSIANPRDPSQVATFFFGLSAEAATRAQRYLFYYGWQSWYVFGPDGKASDRNDFPLGRSPLDIKVTK